MTERPYTVKLVRTLLLLASAGIVVASVLLLFTSVGKLLGVFYLGVFILTGLSFLSTSSKG